MKHKRKRLLFAVYTIIAVGFCTVRLWKYANSFESVVPYEHAFRIHEPEESLWLDLNEATASQLSKLPNVSRPLADAIVAYRTECGGFSSIGQLLDVPGMPESLYYVLGEYTYLTPKTETESLTQTAEESPAKTEPPTIPLLNLNSASAEELCLLPEIGTVTAAAIVDYRTQIGGFFNKLQLLEIRGIGEATYQAVEGYLYIENERPMPETLPMNPEIPETQPYIPEPTEPLLINLNTASREDLLKLPDCSEAAAQEILALRDDLHGFSSTLEITYAKSVTVELYLKWESYLSIDDDGNTEKEPVS